MSGKPDLPGKTAIENWRAENCGGVRMIGHRDGCYAEHAIFLAVHGCDWRNNATRAFKNEVERDLIIWSERHGHLLYPVAINPTKARIQFPLAAVFSWLDAGGRDYILAALRPKADIVAFPGGRA
jgi:hypothetical protein